VHTHTDGYESTLKHKEENSFWCGLFKKDMQVIEKKWMERANELPVKHPGCFCIMRREKNTMDG